MAVVLVVVNQDHLEHIVEQLSFEPVFVGLAARLQVAFLVDFEGHTLEYDGLPDTDDWLA